MTTLIATDYMSSERGKAKSCEIIFPNYCIPEFQDILKVYGEHAAIKVTAEYLSGSFGKFSKFFARMCKRTRGLFRKRCRPLRDIYSVMHVPMSSEFT